MAAQDAQTLEVLRSAPERSGVGETSRVYARVFAVWFKDLRVWSVGSFFDIGWQWPPEFIRPLSAALKWKRLEVKLAEHPFGTLQLTTLHFDGTLEPRELRGKSGFKGKLYFAHAGDVVYSKIDVRNGAIGVVPDEMPTIAVSSEYPVYQILPDVALAEYIKLVFRTEYFRQAINSMISGASGRKRVQPLQIESLEIPLPPLDAQRAIVARWQQAQAEIERAKASLEKVTHTLNELLVRQYRSVCKQDIIGRRWIAMTWKDIDCWDVKTARATTFRAATPSFRPLGDFVEEATELVKPWTQPEKDWPVYGVNNKEGVFFSHYQKGKAFNAAYKRIRKDWFFHNPTRSSVGSLGIVPDVPEDALTSPEYQVWRIKHSMVPGYVAVLVNTPFFISLIQFHRVGAVKQRLYVENLLEMRIPVVSEEEQLRVAAAREAALRQIAETRVMAEAARAEIEALILGTKKL